MKEMLCMPWKHRGGAEVKLHSFLSSKLVGGQYEASCPSYIMSGERDPGTHWIEGWVGSRASLDILKTKKNLITAGNLSKIPWSYRKLHGHCSDYIITSRAHTVCALNLKT